MRCLAFLEWNVYGCDPESECPKVVLGELPSHCGFESTSHANSRSHRGSPPALPRTTSIRKCWSFCRGGVEVPPFTKCPPSCCRHGRSDGAMGTCRGRPTDEYDPSCPHGLFALYFCSVRPSREEDLQLAWGRIMIGGAGVWFLHLDRESAGRRSRDSSHISVLQALLACSVRQQQEKISSLPSVASWLGLWIWLLDLEPSVLSRFCGWLAFAGFRLMCCFAEEVTPGSFSSELQLVFLFLPYK